MCYCVYLGADADLPLVASDVEDPVFSVQPMAASDAAVAQHFTKNNIYHAGSWQGCSCGFANDIDFENPDLVAKNLRSVGALLHYIDLVLLQEDTVELYTCWAGNQRQLPRERRGVSLNEVRLRGFELEEDVLLTFYQPWVRQNPEIQIFSGLTLLGNIDLMREDGRWLEKELLEEPVVG